MTKEQFLRFLKKHVCCSDTDCAAYQQVKRDLDDLLRREWHEGFSEGLKKAEEAVSLGRKLASHFKPGQE
jgi:hypothetical protein